MDIPLVRIPVDGLNVPWQVLGALVFKFMDACTARLPACIRYTRRGWFWNDKADSHLRYGPVWATVTPKNTWVQLGDPDAVYELFLRKQDFIRPYENFSEYAYALAVDKADTFQSHWNCTGPTSSRSTPSDGRAIENLSRRRSMKVS